ncbi:hypothetical protein CGCTS75_v011984 [Colletotrichum tropicale]|nr:uncharacterized protein CGCA056_v008248 [Colletotrichum aenigma]KAF4818572.1 hypothetical protein CGCTS75_v011984 [Colletotrichum tropicale]KAF5519813.1 hypothetical protein CGCA056_v008248 [Colletotrichum aenigma]
MLLTVQARSRRTPTTHTRTQPWIPHVQCSNSSPLTTRCCRGI